MNKEERPGLYVHTPFCRSKCLYCDFYSLPSSEGIPAWLEAIGMEARLYRDRFHRFDSLYLGGGTPSILQERQLAELLELLRGHFSFSPGSEITMEANPDGLSPEKLRIIRDLGVNRISLGVQSLDDGDLGYLGRTHSSEQALRALDMVRSLGFPNIGVDLIYGLETQSLSGWKRTLERIVAFRPEHLSCYQLTIGKDTPLGKMKAAGLIRPIGEKLESAFFLFTSRYLERQGYLHYEISNFAASTEHMCRHNQKYWRRVPYLGLGPSAHSFQAGRRWWNVRSLAAYRELLEAGKTPVEDFEVLSAEQLDLETLGLGLRTREGVDLSAIGNSPEKRDVLEEMRKSGLVRVDKGRIRPTRRGFLVADGLPLMFSG